ncbi:hypothetical protein [Erwinia sp.]|uniref:hypothetical protein n=1 Tax=Erwinia citreus TaxID=558 RepID=UPI003C76CBA0
MSESLADAQVKNVMTVLSTEECLLSLDRPEFKRIPLYDGRPWFVPFVSGWYRLRDVVDKQLD